MTNKTKAEGVVFTPEDLGLFIANGMTEKLNKNKDDLIKIIEPSVGEGMLLDSLLTVLSKKGYSNVYVLGFDINEDYINKCTNEFPLKYPNITFEFIKQDFIDYAIDGPENKFDLLISNPPYVRINHIDDKLRDKIKNNFNLTGKIDLYHVFLYTLDRVLNDNGEIGIVVSNKFLSNKTGNNVRKFIQNKYNIKSIFDFGDTKIFDAAVLPAVLFMNMNKPDKSKKPKFVRIYSENEINVYTGKTLFLALADKEEYCVYKNVFYKIEYGNLRIDKQDDIWQFSSPETDEFLVNINKKKKYILRDIAKAKVGIKTTADKVFISNKWDKMGNNKPENLYDLITHRRAGRIKGKPADKYKVLYPYDIKSKIKKTINLDDYPNTKKYLTSNYDILNARKYIRESNKEWFEIWVTHNPNIWRNKKIVFRDIVEHPTFWLDETNSIVNGDCYWIEFKENISDDIIWLTLGVFNSEFIEKFYDARFNNKLYSNRRRFMTQYVSEFPIPDENSELSKKIIEITKKVFYSKEENSFEKHFNELNKLVYAYFNQKNC